ncbi:hypothetical protein ANANG_G00124810 [Anguilla anguilla]|uniref:Uncharacterized protein n=1 Tax=Anguilla anguilla TaxID=7936 RepID=A0A9D3ME62_ANGAN|nr:hypothetical protein ANANG_G00124810 [Anguilla anguilla]
MCTHTHSLSLSLSFTYGTPTRMRGRESPWRQVKPNSSLPLSQCLRLCLCGPACALGLVVVFSAGCGSAPAIPAVPAFCSEPYDLSTPPLALPSHNSVLHLTLCITWSREPQQMPGMSNNQGRNEPGPWRHADAS